MGDTERHLLRLREEVVRIPVQYQSADRDDRNKFLRDDLRGVEHVEREALCLLLREDLQPQFVFRVRASLNRLPQIAPMEVGVGAGNLDGFIPDQRMRARRRTPMELHEMGFVLALTRR